MESGLPGTNDARLRQRSQRVAGRVPTTLAGDDDFGRDRPSRRRPARLSLPWLGGGKAKGGKANGGNAKNGPGTAAADAGSARDNAASQRPEGEGEGEGVGSGGWMPVASSNSDGPPGGSAWSMPPRSTWLRFTSSAIVTFSAGKCHSSVV